MEVVLDYLMSSPYWLYVSLWCFACAIFTALAPVSVTEKIPDWLMVIINTSAINVGNAANKLANWKGNPNETGTVTAGSNTRSRDVRKE